MQTLLWYRFQTIWKQMKVVLICMGVLAGGVVITFTKEILNLITG